MNETHEAPRSQNKPLLGTRPSVLKELEAQVRGAAASNVAAAGPSQSVPPLAAHEATDSSALAFLLSQSVEAEKEEKEEEEERKKVEKKAKDNENMGKTCSEMVASCSLFSSARARATKSSTGSSPTADGAIGSSPLAGSSLFSLHVTTLFGAGASACKPAEPDLSLCQTAFVTKTEGGSRGHWAQVQGPK